MVDRVRDHAALPEEVVVPVPVSEAVYSMIKGQLSLQTLQLLLIRRKVVREGS